MPVWEVPVVALSAATCLSAVIGKPAAPIAVGAADGKWRWFAGDRSGSPVMPAPFVPSLDHADESFERRRRAPPAETQGAARHRRGAAAHPVRRNCLSSSALVKSSDDGRPCGQWCASWARCLSAASWRTCSALSRSPARTAL